MAKKTDKLVKDLAKEVKKLRKQNERLTETLEQTREDQAESRREILTLLEERLPARGEAREEAPEDSSRGAGVTEVDEDSPSDGSTVESAETPAAEPILYDASGAGEEGPEITVAAKRRAEELGVDSSKVEGTGSGGRILVKDVEAAADDGW